MTNIVGDDEHTHKLRSSRGAKRWVRQINSSLRLFTTSLMGSNLSWREDMNMNWSLYIYLLAIVEIAIAVAVRRGEFSDSSFFCEEGRDIS